MSNFKLYMHKVMSGQDQSIIASLLKILLWVLSIFYSFFQSIFHLLYEHKVFSVHELDKPVICVGNATMGGAGKTPLVMKLAQHFKLRGKKPAILTRGYMSVEGKPSDEATMMAELHPDVPVIVGADRYSAALEALEKHDIDVFIMDDGFQHRQLFRNLNVLVVDASNPQANDHLIPLGMAREPLSQAWVRAHCVVFTKTKGNEEVVRQYQQKMKGLNPVIYVETNHEPVGLTNLMTGTKEDVSILQNKECVAFCSIGDPKSFNQSLKDLGVQVKQNFVFLDHHVFTIHDLDQIRIQCRDKNIKTVVTTHKDAVKIKPFLERFEGMDVYVLNIDINFIKGKNEFFERVNRVL